MADEGNNSFKKEKKKLDISNKDDNEEEESKSVASQSKGSNIDTKMKKQP